VDVCSVIGNGDNIFITESNKLFSIIEDKLHITDFSNEDTFQQVFKKTTYHVNIYTLPIFKAIQNMLKSIVNNEVCNIPEDNEIKLEDGELFHFKIGKSDGFTISGLKQSNNNNEWIKVKNDDGLSLELLSYSQLSNEDLALITTRGIFIYTIVKDFLRLRYFWNNEKWNNHNQTKDNIIIDDYKIIIQEILENEFNNSRSSLPSPNFKTLLEIQDEEDDADKMNKYTKNDYKKYVKLVSNIIDNEPVLFS